MGHQDESTRTSSSSTATLPSPAAHNAAADEKQVSFQDSTPCGRNPSPKARGDDSQQTTTVGTSDAWSSMSDTSNASSEGHYQVIEYDPLDNHSSEDFEELLPAQLNIDENSPAYEALQANASVKVSSVGKAARAAHLQALRKLAKRATGASKSGYKRGKPPRLPDNYFDEESVEHDEEEDDESARLETINETEPQEYTKHVVKDSDVIPDTVVAGTAEAGKKVLGSVDTHDMIKAMRSRKKKIADDKRRKSYVKGKVIDGQHELYTLSIAVMIGVRTSISKTNVVLNAGPGKRWVHIQDFQHSEKYEFRPKGGNMTPPHQLAHTFKFKDYSPVPFAYLRRMFGVNEFDFLLSVCGNANFIEFISNAKSGQFFFYSSDGKYMIKTMTNAESKYLRRVLPEYFRHCAENPNTMMTRFFGMYRVKLYHLRRNVKFIIMNSVYYTDKFLQTFYDLKGSTVGRDAEPGQAVKKDNDLRSVLPEGAIALSPDDRRRVRRQVALDCNFLQSIDAMDYSMLVGIHHIPVAEEKHSPPNTGFKGNRPRSNTGSQPDDNKTIKDDVLVTESGTEKKLNRHSDQIGLYFLNEDLDDDDNSYLLGSRKHPFSDQLTLNEDFEIKKLATIENMYWPFHRLFDIHGNRLMQPSHCPCCNCSPCDCSNEMEILRGYNIPKFVAPLSDRKDRGFVMDTSGLHMPKVLKGPHGTLHYEGKIFYMGIIDILQEYTSRKKLEAKYRLLTTAGRLEASCVPPKPYADRFVAFFDEYSKPVSEAEVGIEIDTSGVLDTQDRMANF